MPEASFTISQADSKLIGKIVDRALPPDQFGSDGRLNLHMDLVAAQANNDPMDLNKLLKADEFNFWHDIGGISKHISRNTGKLLHCFVPRFTK